MSTHLSADLDGICTLRPSVCCVFLPRSVHTAIQIHKDTLACPGSPSFLETYAHVLRGVCLGEWKQTFLCIQVRMFQKNTSAMPLPFTHPSLVPPTQERDPQRDMQASSHRCTEAHVRIPRSFQSDTSGYNGHSTTSEV